ncbi:hypothetical protein OROMI_032826 [Orobanche minor]
MGNQVSSNLKHALKHHDNSTKSSNKKKKKHESRNKQILGILSFEVANVMSKTIHLHQSLTENEILKLKNETLMSEGIRTLISSDEKHLLDLALEEKLDDLNRVASVVSRLGKKCTITALQGFEHVYGDIISGLIDVKELAFLVRDMESMVRKLERYANSTASLYSEMEVMNELETATKKFRHDHHEENRKVFHQKLIRQKQNVGHLKDVSLWNQTYDRAVELLARTVCTIYARIHTVFGDSHPQGDDAHSSSSISRPRVGFGGSSRRSKFDSRRLDVITDDVKKDSGLMRSIPSKNSGHSHKGAIIGFQGTFRPEHFGGLACCSVPGKLFMECLSLNMSSSRVDYDDEHASYDGESSRISDVLSTSSGAKRYHSGLSGLLGHAINRDHPVRESKGVSENWSKFGSKGHAPPSTLGGSSLALHYANIIAALEKFLKYPHLVADEARDDLYQMLPTSLRKTLRISLKAYVKDMAIYDGPIAQDWRGRLDRTFKWLGPLAHNTLKWQSGSHFEQQRIVKRTNVLLVQSLYFADRDRTEGVVCEVLVGLNYICRFEQQQNALLDCGNSFDFEECMDWQSQQVVGSFDS